MNEARFGWFNDKQCDYPNSALAIPGIGFLGINITGQTNLGTATDYPRANPLENRYQFADTANWNGGKHSLKFGFDIMRTEDYTNLLFQPHRHLHVPKLFGAGRGFDGQPDRRERLVNLYADHR